MAHENLDRHLDASPSSNRSFGLVFFAVLTTLGLWPLLHGSPVNLWWTGAGLAFLAAAVLRPQLLALPNRLWTRLGVLMGRIVSPVALALLFFLVLTPIGLLMRLFGKDPLRLKRAPDQPSYWIERTPPGPPPKSMTHPF